MVHISALPPGVAVVAEGVHRHQSIGSQIPPCLLKNTSNARKMQQQRFQEMEHWPLVARRPLLVTYNTVQRRFVWKRCMLLKLSAARSYAHFRHDFVSTLGDFITSN